jgi:hypothetical protein
MFYAVRVNIALAALGIDPSDINEIHRQATQIAGEGLNYSPQEAALLLLTGYLATISRSRIQPLQGNG